MITIYLNDQAMSIAEPMNIDELLSLLNYQEAYFALMLNKNLVPRTQYAVTALKAGDQVEFITPMSGG